MLKSKILICYFYLIILLLFSCSDRKNKIIAFLKIYDNYYIQVKSYKLLFKDQNKLKTEDLKKRNEIYNEYLDNFTKFVEFESKLSKAWKDINFLYAKPLYDLLSNDMKLFYFTKVFFDSFHTYEILKKLEVENYLGRTIYDSKHILENQENYDIHLPDEVI
jgi:hypothetical protein